MLCTCMYELQINLVLHFEPAEATSVHVILVRALETC